MCLFVLFSSTRRSLRLRCKFYVSACLLLLGLVVMLFLFFFFFQAEDGIRDRDVTGVQTCALPIYMQNSRPGNGQPLHGRAEIVNWVIGRVHVVASFAKSRRGGSRRLHGKMSGGDRKSVV